MTDEADAAEGERKIMGRDCEAMRLAARRHGQEHGRTPLDMGAALVLTGLSLMHETAERDATGTVAGFVHELLEKCFTSTCEALKEMIRKTRQ